MTVVELMQYLQRLCFEGKGQHMVQFVETPLVSPVFHVEPHSVSSDLAGEAGVGVVTLCRRGADGLGMDSDGLAHGVVRFNARQQLDGIEYLAGNVSVESRGMKYAINYVADKSPDWRDTVLKNVRIEYGLDSASFHPESL